MYNYYIHMLLEYMFYEKKDFFEMLKEMEFSVTVTSSSMGEIIGRSLGAKTLWYMGNFPGPILNQAAK